MEFDVIIVGGSFAGQAAAMQLGRARRRVLLLDSGRARNRFAKASHGFLGQDGVAPNQIKQTFSSQLQTYNTVEQRPVEVTDVSTRQGGFEIEMADGRSAQSRRIVLASGVNDLLPDIQGIEALWGSSVLHCPYCHGYELHEAPVGVLGDSAMAFHQAMLVRDWGPTTLFTQGSLDLTEEQRGALKRRGVSIEDSPIIEVLGRDGVMDGVRLTNGQNCDVQGLYVAPRTKIVGTLADRLGCKLEEGPLGRFIATDDRQLTSVPGVFAAGDVAMEMSNATLSAASGVKAGAGAHFSLILDDH